MAAGQPFPPDPMPGQPAHDHPQVLWQVITEEIGYEREDWRSLITCCCVNKAWFNFAARLIWAESHRIQLDEVLLPIAPHRRQQYASLIERGMIKSRDHTGINELNDAFGDLEFSVMGELEVDLKPFRCHYLPQLQAPWLRELSLRPYKSLGYGTQPNEWHEVFEHVVVSLFRHKAYFTLTNGYSTGGRASHRWN